MALEIIGDALRVTIAAGLLLAGTLVILIWIKDRTAKVSTIRK
jgi:hypothetical protein